MNGKNYNTPEEEAKRLRTSTAYLAKCRSTKNPDIPYVKRGSRVLYDPERVDAWLEMQANGLGAV